MFWVCRFLVKNMMRLNGLVKELVLFIGIFIVWVLLLLEKVRLLLLIVVIVVGVILMKLIFCLFNVRCVLNSLFMVLVLIMVMFMFVVFFFDV